MNKLKFLSLSLKSLKTTGTVAPSSRQLCHKMTRRIDCKKDIRVLELGAGNGVMTKAILKKMSPGSSLYASEIHPEFCRQLREIEDKRLHVIEGSAEDIQSALPTLHDVSEIDFIISSMPFVILPEDVFHSVLQACQNLLKPEGAFIQFHYSALEKRQYLPYFPHCKISFVPVNIPPAWVYVCTF